MNNLFILTSMILCLMVSFANADETQLANTKPTQESYDDIHDRLQTCTACHGENGASSIPANPVLAGQELYYIYVQIKDIKSGLRDSPVMAPMVAGIEKEKMLRIAEYYSNQTWPESGFTADTGDVAAGKKAVTAGQCVACHLGSFKGNSRVPRLAGQHAEYLEKTMLDFKYKRRLNSPSKGALFASFSDEDIKALANYLAGFKGE